MLQCLFVFKHLEVRENFVSLAAQLPSSSAIGVGFPHSCLGLLGFVAAVEVYTVHSLEFIQDLRLFKEIRCAFITFVL